MGFAQEEYTAIAPAMFDRIRRGIELGHDSQPDVEQVGRVSSWKQLKLDETLKDLNAAVAKVKAADPKGVFYEYEAGHGFSCDQRPSFNPEAAALAQVSATEGIFSGRYLASRKL